MLVSIDQWCTSLGKFYGHTYTKLKFKLTKLKLNDIKLFTSYFLPIILLLLLLLYGDIESNPGSKKKSIPIFLYVNGM